MNPALLLWDIDGTLVHMDRAGERALLQTIRELYGHDLGEHLPVDLRGRTDSSIARDLLTFLDQPITPGEEARLRATYLSLLPQTMPAGKARLQPGVKEALDAIHPHLEIHQGLLTGNLMEGARLKLSHLGIWEYFEFGAFADDSYHRNELGPFALARAKEKLGITFAPDRVFIIGDTPHDIACGKAIGARTIGVATGTFSVEQLAAETPTHVLADLSDTEGFLRLLLEDIAAPAQA